MRKVIYQNSNIEIDSGLFFGRGVFETILVKEKAVFLDEHVSIHVCTYMSVYICLCLYGIS